jgi:hypothetical protein
MNTKRRNRFAVGSGIALVALSFVAGCGMEGTDLAPGSAEGDGGVVADAAAQGTEADAEYGRQAAAIIIPDTRCIWRPEICNGVDDNCDGVVDERCPVGVDLGAETFVSPMFGGTGGGVRVLDCPAGQVAIGIYGRSGASIDRLGLDCGTPRVVATPRTTGEYINAFDVLPWGLSSPPAGGLGGSVFEWAVPQRGVVIEAFGGHFGTGVNGVWAGYEDFVIDHTLGTWSVRGIMTGSASPEFGTTSGTSFGLACRGNDEVVTGLTVRSGTMIDAVSVNCRRMVVRLR